MFTKFLVRDAILVVVVVLAWWLAWPLSVGDGPMADVSGVLLGLGAGLVSFVGHEWGHLAGALATGSRVAEAKSLAAPFFFSFDSKLNSQTQFVVMSLSGFAVTALALYVAYGLLPVESLATRVTRGLVVFSASLTVFLEIPLLTISLLKGSMLAQVEVFPADRA